MCGIVGIVSSEASGSIQKMTDALIHRGPDDSGLFTHENVAFGHQRLAILDLTKNAHQPMISSDDKFVILFNGEIYNHWELRKKIENKYTFRSNSDTETILYGYIEYGNDLFNRLNGIFVIAIYNIQTNELIIARDHFGIKPLYYYFDGINFLFSSEIKSLIEYPYFEKKLNYNSLANYLYFLWSPASETPFELCKKLLPGHFITINTKDISSLTINKYYEIPFKGTYAKKPESTWINELDTILTKAVERQLLSDVPVGFFLSGGLDSSLIVAIARKLQPHRKLKCYTIDTKSNSIREGTREDLPYAKMVADYLDVNLEIVPANIDILRDFDKMIYHLDEPQSDPAPLNVYNICQKAREQGYTVLLGGAAGDDVFSGYRRHQSLFYERKINFIPFLIKKQIFKLSQLLNYESAVSRRIKKQFSIYLYEDERNRSASLYGWLPQERVKRLFKVNIGSFCPNEFLINSLQNIPKEMSRLNQMLFWELKYFLPDHNLNYTDKMSMAHGVEIRVPYLDKELVEFSTTIPPELKMKGFTTKYLLRKVAEKYLPFEVVNRPKSGFGAPVRDWVINDLRDKIETILSKSVLLKQGIFNYEEIFKLIEENEKGIVDASYSIWGLLSIQSWLNQFWDKQ
jgi:asparagine synthase (glutamine-hydrolysing)